MINEEGKTYFMIDNKMDILSGTKTIEISTSISLINNLDVDISIGIIYI